jgi:flagellar motor switch protein FliN
MVDIIKKIPNPEEIIDLWVTLCKQAFIQSVDAKGVVELADVQVNETGPANYVKPGCSFLRIERNGQGGFVVASSEPGFSSDQVLQTAGKEAGTLFPLFLEEVNRVAQKAFGPYMQCSQAPADSARASILQEDGLGYFLALMASTSNKANYTVEFYFSPDLCLMLEEGSKVPAAKPPAAKPAAPPAASAPATKEDPFAAAPKPNYSKNIDRIMDIDLPLTVSFGRTRMLLKDVMKLGTGSIIELDRTADDPVDLWVNDKKVARGEVVIIGGNYGVRITEVENVAERINTLRD